MSRAFVKVSGIFIREMLGMPPEWTVESVDWNHDRDETRVTVSGERIPGSKADETVELQCLITQHEDGTRCFKWGPMPEPGPSEFLAESGTGKCFFCGESREQHGPDWVCLKPLLERFKVKNG